MKQRMIGCAPCQGIADGLKQRYKHQQDNHTDIDDVLVMEILPVVDGKAADAAGFSIFL